MKNATIIASLRNYKICLAELSVIENCAPVSDGSEDRRAFLTRKVSLIKNWVDLLLPDERVVIAARLVEREKWPIVNKKLAKSRNVDYEFDERTLQRIQRKAVSKIAAFMMDKFQDELDYLFAEDE